MQRLTIAEWCMVVGFNQCIVGLVAVLLSVPPITPMQMIASGLGLMALRGAYALLRRGWQRYRHWRHARYARV